MNSYLVSRIPSLYVTNLRNSLAGKRREHDSIDGEGRATQERLPGDAEALHAIHALRPKGITNSGILDRNLPHPK